MRISHICRNDPLTIRKMNDCMKDYMLMSKWLSDPVVLQYYEGRDNPFDLSRVMEHYGPRTRGEEDVIPCIIEYNEKAIGYIQYYRADGEGSVIEERPCREMLSTYVNPYGIDLFIGETDCWSKGIGTMAVRLLVGHLLGNHIADVVLIDPQTWNTKAIRCYEKCGFTPIAVLEKKELHEGEYRDNLVMFITDMPQ